jgi:nitroreductase
MSEAKKPALDFPVHQLIAQRWSPYYFDEKVVSAEVLSSVFEAARWAASAFNEQPWRYIVASRENEAEFGRLLSCLVGPNQAWAKRASVLALAVISENYEHNGKPNGTALHDMGLASANLTLEAANQGLMVHQMAGILPDQARELYQIPEGYVAVTALALGYPGEGEGELAQRDQAPRERKTQAEFVFGGAFGQAYGQREVK